MSRTGLSTGTIAGVVAMPNQVSTRGMMSLRASACQALPRWKDVLPEHCNGEKRPESKRDRIYQLSLMYPAMEKSVFQRL